MAKSRNPYTDSNTKSIKKDAKSFRELGSSGLRQASGFVHEEKLPKLKTLRDRMVVYKEMENDPIVGAILFAIEMHLSSVNWTVKCDSDDPKAQYYKDFIQECIDDMSHTFSDFIVEVTSMLPYGFSIHEIVYKIRKDGMIAWKKWPIRSQDSIYKWDFDEENGLNGFYQRPKFDTNQVYIPIEKCLLFRPKVRKGNPEGRSVLRNAYKPYYFKKKLETIEAIGIERDLSGYPVLHVPFELFSDNELAKEMRDYAQDVVTRVRKDEQMGSVLPPNWELELLSASGRSNVDTDQVINRYSLQIAQSLLSDVIMMGSNSSTGSYALSDKKYDMFIIALTSWLNNIADVLNKYAIPRLLKLNGASNLDEQPKLVPEPVEKRDPLKLSNTLYRLAGIDAIEPDNELERYLRDFLGLPEKEESTNRNSKDEEEQRIGEREDNITRPPQSDGEYDQSEDSNL